MPVLPPITARTHESEKFPYIEVRRGELWAVKVPFSQALALADQIVDLVEQHDQGGDAS